MDYAPLTMDSRGCNFLILDARSSILNIPGPES